MIKKTYCALDKNKNKKKKLKTNPDKNSILKSYQIKLDFFFFFKKWELTLHMQHNPAKKVSSLREVLGRASICVMTTAAIVQTHWYLEVNNNF